MECVHGLVASETAVHDGMCPICLFTGNETIKKVAFKNMIIKNNKISQLEKEIKELKKRIKQTKDFVKNSAFISEPPDGHGEDD